MKPNHYEVLGIKKSATQAEIKTAYRKMVRKYHPDVNKTPGASNKFKEISRANQILSNPLAKAEYDRSFNQQNYRRTNYSSNESKHYSNNSGNSSKTSDQTKKEPSSEPKQSPPTKSRDYRSIFSWLIILSIFFLPKLISNSHQNTVASNYSSASPSPSINSVTQTDLTTPVYQFYSNVTSKNLFSAWLLLSKNFQNYAGGFSSFNEGYSNTVAVNTNNVYVQDLSNRLVYVNLTSTDNVNGYNVKKSYEGTWKLVNENNTWKLDEANIVLIDPITDCNIQEIGVVKLKQSECAQSFACQIGSQWIRYTSRDQCSKDQNAQTASLNPNAVNITSINALGGGKVSLSWNAFSDKVLYYTVYYGPTSGTYDYNTSAGKNTNIEIGGIPVGSKFYFTVQAGGWQHNYYLDKDVWATSARGNEASIDVK